jgi:hypothetical protein
VGDASGKKYGISARGARSPSVPDECDCEPDEMDKFDDEFDECA